MKEVLACRLRQKYASTAGEVELENISVEAVEIDWQMSPLQYLDLVVTDATGKVVSEWFYGDCFSPMADPQTLRLRPGEEYIQNVSLLGNVPPEKLAQGRYTVQAVFNYKSTRVASDKLQFHYEE